MKKLLQKLFQRGISSEERARLAEQESVKLQLEKQWNLPGNFHQRDSVNGKVLWSTIQKRCGLPTKRVPNRRYLWVAGWAATVALLLGGVGLLQLQKEPELLHVKAPNSELLKWELPDNSIVWINKASEISYRKDFLTSREVHLTGEAYFEVMPLEERPFEVYLNGAKVEVKGTQFSIHTTEKLSEVILFSGSVHFTNTQTGEVACMEPTDKIAFDAENGTMLKSKVSLKRNDWRKPTHHFSNERLGDLLQFMETWYGVSLVLRNPSHAEILFSGRIKENDTLEDVLDKICISTNLNRKQWETKIELY